MMSKAAVSNRIEVHDRHALATARAILDACADARDMGGASSKRLEGPAGGMGRKIVDIPVDPHELIVDIDTFRKAAPLVRPKLIALGLSMTLFPQPVSEMKAVIQDWGGRLFFDAAHQLGLIGGRQFQDPLKEGADIMTGSAGQTFFGPPTRGIVRDGPASTEALATCCF